MKNIKDYIINENEQQINEFFVPPISLFPPEWQPYIGALYGLEVLWLSAFFVTEFEDYTFGIKTIKEIVKNKFDDFKYKRELKEFQKILDQNEDYINWNNSKKKRLKDLTSIVLNLKKDGNVKEIIKDIWEKSKNI